MKTEENTEEEFIGGSDVQAYDKEENLNLYGGNDAEEPKTQAEESEIVGGSRKQNRKRKTVRRTTRQQKKQLRKKTQKRQQKKQQKKSLSRKNKKGGKGFGLETASVPLALFATQQYIARKLGKQKKSRRVTRKN
jgi:hypothetical protein